ncbi:MAG: hypothetical protein KJ941_06010 [Bacteroidetes bacterium]|nr:hypothetical protein [Bacteroidota bacterium]
MVVVYFKIQSPKNIDFSWWCSHVMDYNAIRLHISLNGSTPDEAYSSGLVLPKNLYQPQFKKARTIRITENKKNTCGSCT